LSSTDPTLEELERAIKGQANLEAALRKDVDAVFWRNVLGFRASGMDLKEAAKAAIDALNTTSEGGITNGL
jgi:hypothetical protein